VSSQPIRDEHRRDPHPRLLFFDEVEAAGLPAVFASFGDLLLYREGIVYALPPSVDPADPVQVDDLADAYALRHRVGIEFPWRHTAGCGCRFCAPETDLQVA
jgi:hypothetical protein